MRYKLAFLIVLVGLIMGKFAYDRFVPPFAMGEPAPDFSLSDLNGETVRLSDMKGMPVLVHFWATWCNQCVSEMPSLDGFAKEFDSEIKVLAISEDEGGAEAILGFFGKIRPSFAVLMDTEGRVADRYKSFKVPETYLVDKEGRILHRFVGAVEWMNPKTASFIRDTLSGSN